MNAIFLRKECCEAVSMLHHSKSHNTTATDKQGSYVLSSFICITKLHWRIHASTISLIFLKQSQLKI